MSEIDLIKKPIREEMKRFEGFFSQSLDSNIPLLRIVTNYILRRKGKQLRPMFVFLSAGLYGKITHSTYIAASLIELLHTATLVHDDVVDNSFERRGFFSVRAIWKSKIAVLFGDYLLAWGLLLSVQNKEYQLLEIVSDAVREISEGELLQLQKSRKLDINESEYFDIIRKKTATLIAACTACGCKSAGNNEEEVSRLKQFGEYVGIAFQIKDDLFDYQNNGLTGKPVGNDIQEKKLTLPLIHSLTACKPEERRKILRLLKRKKKKSSEVREVIRFVRAHGGDRYAAERMIEYRDRAIDIIAPYPESPEKTALIRLVNYTVDRNK